MRGLALKDWPHTEYPKSGWFFVVVKDKEGEAKFLHSMQVKKDLISISDGFYFSYESESGIFDPIRVSVNRRFNKKKIGYVGVPNKVPAEQGIKMLEMLSDLDLDFEKGNMLRTRMLGVGFRTSVHMLRGDVITKSQFETYKLLTNLPVLSPNVW